MHAPTYRVYVLSLSFKNNIYQVVQIIFIDNFFFMN